MSESPIAITEKPQSSPVARIGWAVLIVATLYVCYFSHLGAIGFVGPDEPRYAWIARDMAETGDWVTPRLYGKPWFEKPPLFYWGAALSFKLFGVSEAAARLPSAISALLATLALAWLALRLYGAETARWLLLLLPTTVGMIGFSHAAATDMPFSGMLTIAMVCAAVVLGLTRNENSPILPRTPWLALILFGFFLGLAVLAKGPAAIILCGGAVFFWALFTKRWRDAFRLFHLAAIAAFCLTALPWYILCARRNPDFFRIFIIEHNFKRFFTPEFQHIQPLWFYIPVDPRRFHALDRAACVLAFERITKSLANPQYRRIQFVFTLLGGILRGFLYRLAFKVARLRASRHSCHRHASRPRSESEASTSLGNLRWICCGVALTFAFMGTLAGVESEKIPFVTDMRPPPTVTQCYLVAVLAGIVVGILAVLKRLRVALMLASIVLPAFLAFGTKDLWQLDEGVSARPVAVISKAEFSFPEDLLQNAATYKLRRGLVFGLNFYFKRELPEWVPPGGQRAIIFASPRGPRN